MLKQTKKYKSIFFNPVGAFIILATIFGFIYVFLIPLGAGWDETSHLARDWEMSSGYLIPNQLFNKGPHFPLAFTLVSYRDQLIYSPVSPTYFKDNIGVKIDWSIMTNTQTRSVYPPLLSLPQAFILGILGHIFDAPVLIMYYLCRLLELLGYILLVALAIHLIPYGKWTLAFLALAPTALYQAATIGTDPYTNGIAFLYIAWILSLALQEKPIDGKQTLYTALITFLLFSAKNNAYFLILLLFLVPVKKYCQKRYFWAIISTSFVVFLVLGLGWNVFAIKNFSLSGTGYSVSGQLHYILSNPLSFIAMFFKDIGRSGLRYLTEDIAVFGYLYRSVPSIVYWLFGLGLILVIFQDATAKPLTTKTRLILLGSACVGYALTVSLIYLRFQAVGATSITEVQGRYFILISPLLALALIPRKSILPVSLRPSIPLWIGVISILAIFGAGIYLSYYTYCGSAYYTSGSCDLPKYKNWDPNAQFSPAAVKNTTITQIFIAKCAPITSFSVWPLNNSGMNNQSTVYTLYDLQTGQATSSVTLANKNVPSRQWLSIPISPLPGSMNKQYKIVITSSIEEASQALNFSITARHEYNEGEFYINSQLQNNDLVFQYSCPIR